jgi:pyruvate,water dikinase
MALVRFESLSDPHAKREIERLTIGYQDKEAFFVDRLAQGVAKIAAAFYPRDVIVRMSDFKSNEYANLIGGSEFEPIEDNPMIGFRGASRYYDESYQEGFALECKAMKKVRDEMGLTNVKLMIPFCRTVEEGRLVVAEMRNHGLIQGQYGLEIYMMCEIPSNVIMADEFSEVFDGFSIGSNDLTQLVLGLDRDSEKVSHIFDERDPAVKRMVQSIIESAKKNGKRRLAFAVRLQATIQNSPSFWSVVALIACPSILIQSSRPPIRSCKWRRSWGFPGEKILKRRP